MSAPLDPRFGDTAVPTLGLTVVMQASLDAKLLNRLQEGRNEKVAAVWRVSESARLQRSQLAIERLDHPLLQDRSRFQSEFTKDQPYAVWSHVEDRCFGLKDFLRIFNF